MPPKLLKTSSFCLSQLGPQEAPIQPPLNTIYVWHSSFGKFVLHILLYILEKLEGGKEDE